MAHSPARPDPQSATHQPATHQPATLQPATPRPNLTPPPGATGALALSDGAVFWGRGFGAEGARVGEVCFNTAMTGYQEIMTDPSYAGQIVTFTFPHIGNVGVNDEDVESITPAALGLVQREPPTAPSNWRAGGGLGRWLAARDLIGLSGIDTRRLTRLIRDRGALHATLVHAADGRIDAADAVAQAAAWSGLTGRDLARDVTCRQTHEWRETNWRLGEGYGEMTAPTRHVVAIDYGAKRNILRCLATLGCRVTVVPATATAEEVMGHRPDGIFLSNGPGDPAATGTYAAPAIRALLETRKPMFGICLGHQMLALALGARTEKMKFGHHGANHPVKDLETGKVEITSMNHGFAVSRGSLPSGVVETHMSLFDGSNCGLRMTDRPVFSVQYHPEASPGPRDSHYLFRRFVDAIDAAKAHEPARERLGR